jgi:inorganic pyrophosphatase
VTSARTVVIERLRFGVSDLARSRAFYAGALAPLGIAEDVGGGTGGDGAAIARFSRAGALVLELEQVATAPVPVRITLAVDGAAPVRDATLTDPDGHTLEIVDRRAAATARVPDDRLVAVVEIPKGTRNKYEYDPVLGGFTFDRLLMTAAAYPADYGYFPGTLGEDGDPLDVLVCLSEPTFPGCLIPVKPVGLFKMADDQGIDDKVICVPLHDPNWGGYDALDELPQLLRNEIAQFFAIYKELEGKKVDVGGWFSRPEAERSIDAARARFRERREQTGISFPGPGGELPGPEPV